LTYDDRRPSSDPTVRLIPLIAVTAEIVAAIFLPISPMTFRRLLALKAVNGLPGDGANRSLPRDDDATETPGLVANGSADRSVKRRLFLNEK